MDQNLQKTCDLIVANRQVLRKEMNFWGYGRMHSILGAMMIASRGMEADGQKYAECKKLLKQNANIFSTVRGMSQEVLVTKMTMVEDPETYIQGVIEVYKKLRSIHKLRTSTFMVMAAMNIYEHAGVEGADEDIEKMEELYKKLHKKHPFVVDQEDRGYLSMLIAAEADVEETFDKIEASYKACKKFLVSNDSVQSAAQILALSKLEPQAQAEFIDQILKGLSENKKRIVKDYGYPAIAALALLDVPADQLIAEITEADDYLKTCKGFKWYDLDSNYRKIFSILAVFMNYAENDDKLGSALGANISVSIIESLIYLIIIISTTISVAVATSVSTSSH